MHAGFGTFSAWGAGVHRKVGSQHPSVGLAGTRVSAWPLPCANKFKRDGYELPMSTVGTSCSQARGLAGKTGGAGASQDQQGEGSSPSTPSSTGVRTWGDAPSHCPGFSGRCVSEPPSTCLQNKPRTARRETGNCYLSNLILFYFFFFLLFWGGCLKCVQAGLRLQPG